MRRSSRSRATRTTTRSRRTSSRSRANRLAVRKNRRRLKLKRFLWPILMLVILSAIGAGVYSLLTAPELEVRGPIDVRGAELIDASLIAKDADMAIGRNILLLPKSQMLAKIMRHPEVAEARVGRILPRTVVVTIMERTPFAVVQDSNRMVLCDDAGLVIKEIKRQAKDLPLLSLPGDAGLKPGGKVIHPGWSGVDECAKNCMALNLKPTKIAIDRTGNLCLNIGSDFYIKMGGPVDIREKLAGVSRILASRRGIAKEALYIDVSCSKRPAWKPKSAVEEKPGGNI